MTSSTVQSPLSRENLGPVLCLWEAAGVSDDERAVLAERIRELASAEQAGGLALGVLIGLLATAAGGASWPHSPPVA